SESKRLMKGHKGERFGLDVSFIGWLLLISLADTLGAMAGISFMGYIIGIFFYPFYHLTAAAYYRRLTNDDLPDLDGWVPEV
ncbi:MAG: DUF975 family protein, partial [Oscillospiraceae bacterium]|nr:DUF975 family protein [Oscillospiraceae bacterium]